MGEKPPHARLKEAIEGKGIKQKVLAAKIGWLVPRLNKVLNGGTELSLEDLRTIAEGAGLDPLTFVRVGSESDLEVQAVPYVPIRRLPVGVPAEKMAEAIRKIEHEKIPMLVGDPLAFGLKIEAKIGDFEANTIQIVTPGRRPRKGKPFAFRVGPMTLIGQYTESQGAPAVFFEGDLYTSFEPLGPVYSSTTIHLD